jgi:hypothetical protein
MNAYLIDRIEFCLRRIRNFAMAGFDPARRIERQLIWCWKSANGQAVDPLASPLCMSWLLEGEFTIRYGEYPELVESLQEIENHIHFTPAMEFAMAA